MKIKPPAMKMKPPAVCNQCEKLPQVECSGCRIWSQCAACLTRCAKCGPLCSGCMYGGMDVGGGEVCLACVMAAVAKETDEQHQIRMLSEEQSGGD